MKTIIKDAYAKTGDPFLGSPVVDFGVRGSAGGPMGGLHASAAALGGFAHFMVSDMSDNMPALHFAQTWGFRGPLKDQPLPLSIFATEHSIMTSFGHHEQTAFHHMLATAPDKPISIVMDAYDLFKAIDTLGIHFRDQQILARPETAPVIIHPDSVDPHIILPKVLTMLAGYFLWHHGDGPGLRPAQPARARDPGRRHLGRQARQHLRRRHRRQVCARQSHLWLGGRPAPVGNARYAQVCLQGLPPPACSVRQVGRDDEQGPDHRSRQAEQKEGLLTVECNDGVLSTVVAKTVEAYEENQAKSILKTYYMYEDGLLVSFDSLQEMRARVDASESRKRKRDEGSFS